MQNAIEMKGLDKPPFLWRGCSSGSKGVIMKH